MLRKVAQKLLFAMYCDNTAETGVSFWTHIQTHRRKQMDRMDGRMDRQLWKLK